MYASRLARGAPDWSTSSSCSGCAPIKRAAWARGLPMVAVAAMKVGREPWKAATRRNLPSTWAMCEPNTPR